MQRLLHTLENLTRHTYLSRILYTLCLLSLLTIAFAIRLQGRERIPNEQFTSNDAYLYYWQAKTISENGYIPAIDKFRWLPNGRDNGQLLSLYSYVLAYIYKIINLFFYNITLYHVCLYLPVICFIIGLGFLIIFLTKMYGFNFATIVAVLLATLPGSIDRSLIGFADRDAWCWMIGLLSIMTYLWKEQMPHGRKRWIATVILGFIIFLGGLSWEGYGFFLLIIMSAEIWKFCTTERKDNLLEYILMIVMFVPWLYLISPAYRSGFGYSTHVGMLMLAPPLVILFLKSSHYLLLRFVTILQSYSKRLSWGLTLMSLFTGCIYIYFQYDTFATTAFPFQENRLMQIIQELADPDLNYWFGRYGSIFVLGTLGIITASLRQWKAKAVILVCALTFLFLTVFLRSPMSYRLSSNFTNILFLSTLPLVAIGIAIIATRKLTTQNELVLLTTLVWFFLWVTLSRSGKRYDFFIGVPLSLGTAFLLNEVLSLFTDNKVPMTIKGINVPPTLLKVVSTLTMLALLLFWNPIGGHATRSLEVAKVKTFYPENPNIMQTYNWVKNKLNTDHIVMAAHWEYGTQLNVHSNVKTITDPDHYLPHWVHLYYRHLYCAQSETEALYFLKTHNATHLMLTSTDIIGVAGKASYVGSDQFFDRHFNLHPLLYLPTAPGTQYSLSPQSRPILGTFTPSTTLTAIEIKGKSLENLRVIAHFKTEENIQLPYIAYHGSKRIVSPQTVNTRKGGLVLTFDTKHILRNAYYVPEIGWNSLAFKLFIRGEHSEAFDNIYTNNSKENDRPPDVQIWRIKYPEHIKTHPKYLETE